MKSCQYSDYHNPFTRLYINFRFDIILLFIIIDYVLNCLVEFVAV